MTVDTLRGRTALVTGGSRGIGAAISRALAEAGAAVAINYRDRSDEATKLAEDLRKSGANVITVQADVSLADAVSKMVGTAKSELGGIDILINNAGVAITRGIDDLSESDFDRTIATNLKSVFLCTRAVVPAMKRQGGGWIVNVASVAGLVGNPNLSGYNASKFGLMGFSESTMLELRHAGIRVSVICPGSVATEFGHGPNVAGMLAADDVAQATMAILLAAPDALLSQIHLRPLRPPRR